MYVHCFKKVNDVAVVYWCAFYFLHEIGTGRIPVIRHCVRSRVSVIPCILVPVPCSGPVSWPRVPVPYPGPVSRSRVLVPYPWSRVPVPVPCSGPVFRSRVPVPCLIALLFGSLPVHPRPSPVSRSHVDAFFFLNPIYDHLKTIRKSEKCYKKICDTLILVKFV